MFYELHNGKVNMRIKAQPAASKNAFCELYGEDSIKVRIKAPAVEGAANKELIKFLSKSFRVPKRDIIFKTGQNSKIKILEFPLSDEFESWIKTIE